MNVLLPNGDKLLEVGNRVLVRLEATDIPEEILPTQQKAKGKLPSKQRGRPPKPKVDGRPNNVPISWDHVVADDWEDDTPVFDGPKQAGFINIQRARA